MRSAVLLALFAAACATTYTPRQNTHQDIAAYVDRAASVVRDHGPSCDTFAKPEWKSGDWYIFVLEPNGRTLCHPAKPELVGTMVTDLVDANGKRIGDEFVRTASAQGGWVDYVWPRPGGTAPVAKSSYVRLVAGPGGKSYIVGSGGYELK